MRPTLRVDTSIVVNNWKTLNGLVGPTVSCTPVVKANAYGLGIEPISLALTKAGGDSFFVADPPEGSELRKIVGGAPKIYVLGGYVDFYAQNYVRDILVPLLNSRESASRFLNDHPHLDYGVQIETGLNRLGLSATDLAPLHSKLRLRPPTLIISHLACADDSNASMNTKQLLSTIEIASAIPRTPNTKVSIAGSDALLIDDRFHMDMVRPGISLYCGGLLPGLRDPISISARTLKPTFSKWPAV